MIYLLADCKEKEKLVISEIKLTGEEAEKLDKLGIFVGENVFIEKIFAKSVFVVNAEGASIALGREIAEKILVKGAGYEGKQIENRSYRQSERR